VSTCCRCSSCGAIRSAGGDEIFEECARLAPPEFRWAREWLAVSRYDAADSSSVQDLRDIVAADPYATIARERLSDYCMSTRDIPGAEKLFKEILAVDPDDNLPWIGLAEVARIHHQLDEAFRLTTEAVKRWDVNPVHLVLHGTLATQAGDLRLAEASFRRALAAGADGETADRARKGLALLEQIRSGRVKVADVRAAMMGQDPAKDPSP